MSQKWSNRYLPGALHFVTGNVLDRRQIFRTDKNCEAFLKILQELREKMETKLCSFVLMPDHFHLVSNPRNGRIIEWTGALKSMTAKALTQICPADWFIQPSGENQVWHESFKALALWSHWMIWQKVNYIHSNPLRAKLVASTKDYRWSSFHSIYGGTDDPLLQPDKDWRWPEDAEKLDRAMKEWSEERKQKQRSTF